MFILARKVKDRPALSLHLAFGATAGGSIRSSAPRPNPVAMGVKR